MIRLRIHLLGLWREVMRHSEGRVRKLDRPRIYSRGIVIPAAPRSQLSFAAHVPSAPEFGTCPRFPVLLQSRLLVPLGTGPKIPMNGYRDPNIGVSCRLRGHGCPRFGFRESRIVQPVWLETLCGACARSNR